MRTRVRRLSLVTALACVVLALAGGCSPKKVMNPNVPPETSVFVQGTVDTVSYRAHLYWFGSDVDGYVVAYEIRFLNPDRPADTAWVRTTKTDSLFSVFTPTGVSKPVFEVRAIDDGGLTDPTPAEQSFTFSNQPPVLTSISGPGSTIATTDDTTYASATISWTAADPDGDIAKASYRVWLDGNAANPLTTAATTVTIPPDAFLQGGQLLSGTRKVFVQAIDEAGYAAQPDSLTWFVRAPAAVTTNNRARLLIIDDVPANTRENFRQDTLYVNTAVRNLPAGTFSILRLNFTQPFRSTADLENTFKLFDAVLWYRGTETTLQPLLTNYQDGVAHYLEQGGKFFIESQFLLEGTNSQGIFPESWVSRFLGSDSLYTHATAVVGMRSASWGINAFDSQNNPIVIHSPKYGVDMTQTQIFGELRGFAVRDTHDVVTWARAGTLAQDNAVDVPIAVSVGEPGGGRFIAVTFPVRSANATGTIPTFLAKAFEDMGLTGSSFGSRASFRSVSGHRSRR